MPESFEDYRRRVLGYLGDLDPIAVQGATAARLAERTRGLARESLLQRPDGGGWCILEVVVHMADAELAMGWRIRSMLAEPGVDLAWFDQEAWARVLDYRAQELEPALQLFAALRASNLALLSSVPRRIWNDHYGVHSFRGHQTLADFVSLEAAHDLSHLRQIERMLDATEAS